MRISDWSSDVCSSDLLRWTAGRLDIARRTREIERRSISREAAIDEYIGIFRAAMERIRPDDQDYIHPLSGGRDSRRSEEHTSELQSLMRISYAVFCLKKKTKTAN